MSNMVSSTRKEGKKYDLEERLVRFAALIIKYCQSLPDDNTGQYYARQLMRSGGSAALNFGEAQGTFTDKDYVHKGIEGIPRNFKNYELCGLW